MKFAIIGPETTGAAEQWLAAGTFGGQATVGSTSVEFHRTDTPALVEDFLQGPPKDMDAHGILSIHYDGQTQHIPVSPNIGKKLSLGDKGPSVEIVEYLPNAEPEPGPEVHFVSHGSEPKYPMLELRVHLPGKKEPMHRSLLRRRPS